MYGPRITPESDNIVPPIFPNGQGYLELIFFTKIRGVDHLLFQEKYHVELKPRGAEQF